MQNLKTHGLFLRVAAAALTLTLTLASGCSESKPPNEFEIQRSTVGGLPSVTATNSTQGQVEVEAIDYDTRSISLKGDDGKSDIFHVNGDIRNFDQIKKGDHIHVQYTQQINVSVRRVDQPLSATETAALTTAPLGQKPGLLAVRTVNLLATVIAIDYQARTATLKAVDDSVFHVTVNPNLPSFDNVHVGDQVVFDYTESLAIDVGAPKN